MSILMGVFDCEPYLEQCVASIQSQSFTSWELLICDDSSEDATLTVANSLAAGDPRIRVLANDRNRGLAWTLNRCAGHASGRYLARQDGDDRSAPDRLEKEVHFLNAHPRYDIVSTGMSLFDEGGLWGRIYNVQWPTQHDFIPKSPFSHAASMVRREAFFAVGGYRDITRTWRVEDYDLWFRMYERGSRGHNIQECLYEVRDDRGALGRRKLRFRLNESVVKVEGYRRLGVSPVHYPRALRPIVVGLVPPFAYGRWRRRRYGGVKPPIVADGAEGRWPPVERKTGP